MGSTVLYMSMSADGFITGPNVRPDNAMGDGGQRLHEWVFPKAEPGDMVATGANLSGANREVFDEMMSSGAVIAGRNKFEPAGGGRKAEVCQSGGSAEEQQHSLSYWISRQ